jgi:hypothetical protein
MTHQQPGTFSQPVRVANMDAFNKPMAHRLLNQIRSEFDQLRWKSQPIRGHFTHKATNAEAEGVQGTPFSTGDFIAPGAGRLGRAHDRPAKPSHV